MLAYPTQLRVLNFPTFSAHHLPSRFVEVTQIPQLQTLQITQITSSACPMFATVLQFPDEIATHRCANWHYHPLLRSNYIPVLADVARCSSVSRQNRHTAALIRLSSAPGGSTGSLRTVLDTLARPSEGTQFSDFLRISPSCFLIWREFLFEQKCYIFALAGPARSSSTFKQNSNCSLTSSKTRYSIDYQVSKRKNHGLLLPSHLIDANSLLSSVLTPANATVQRYYVRRCTDNVNWQFCF